MDFSMKQAKFYCSKSWDELQIESYARPLIDRWLQREELLGWSLRGKILIRKIRCVNEADLPTDAVFGRAGLWHPYMLFKHNTIPYEHPYVAERDMANEDLFVVWAPMTKPVEFKVVERDDEFLEELIEEDSPLLKQMVIH